MKLAAELPVRTQYRIKKEIEAELREAFDFAESSDFPDASELMTDIYQEGTDAFATAR